MSSPQPRRRLNAATRREAILNAALPLFAARGQDGVTTRELAGVCGISEALIFRHFPTKQALFEAIHAQHSSRVTARGYPRADPGESASAEALVRLVCRFVHYVVINNATADHQVMRLFYRSFVEDGRFARDFLASDRLEVIRRDFTAALLAARTAGDALPLATDPLNLFWFVQHATTAACLMRLPARPVIRYRGAFRLALHDLVRFVLRGIGVREPVLARLATAENFDRWTAAAAVPPPAVAAK